MSVKEIRAALDAGAPSIGTAKVPKKRAKKKNRVRADQNPLAFSAHVVHLRKKIETLTPFEAGLAMYAFESDPSSATMSGEAALESIGMIVSAASALLSSSASYAAKTKTTRQLERLRKAIVWAKKATKMARATGDETAHLR